MERNIVLYIAMSLDGYIARENGAVDWLVGHSGRTDIDYGYQAFYSTIDTVLMGRVTYQQLIHELSPDVWPYEGRVCYVATTSPLPPDSRVEFFSGDVVALAQGMRRQPGRDIWLVGGAQLIVPFVRANAIDRYIVSVIPTILGGGIPLFAGQNPEIKLRLTGTRETDGLVELTYVRREPARP